MARYVVALTGGFRPPEAMVRDVCEAAFGERDCSLILIDYSGKGEEEVLAEVEERVKGVDAGSLAFVFAYPGLKSMCLLERVTEGLRSRYGGRVYLAYSKVVADHVCRSFRERCFEWRGFKVLYYALTDEWSLVVVPPRFVKHY